MEYKLEDVSWLGVQQVSQTEPHLSIDTDQFPDIDAPTGDIQWAAKVYQLQIHPFANPQKTRKAHSSIFALSTGFAIRPASNGEEGSLSDQSKGYGLTSEVQ